jgi:Zn-dependent protease with chaperone function
MPQVEFDFAAYIRQRRGANQSRAHGGAAYSYPGDQKVLATLGRVTPVRLAVEATVRLWKNVARSQILGSSVKVTDKQFPEIYNTTIECARKLQIAVPTVYIAPQVGSLDAHTFGTTDDAYIVLNGVLIDHLTPAELEYVIGHECGHIQNNHVVYSTALYYLMYSANIFVRWIVQPAIMALQSWSRRAEITCDRAGLICCGDLDTANRSLVKLALGSQKLAEHIDMDEYLKQLDESQKGAGRMLELFQSHPYLPKRVAALRFFAQTHFFSQASGKLPKDAPESEGKSLSWCDARVARLLSIFSSNSSDENDENDENDASSTRQE